MNIENLKKEDPEIYELIRREEARQTEGLELIPSENYASPAVLEALGSILNDKYAEGYPGKRYYGGNAVIDDVERLACRRALQAFGAEGYAVNVQPYSGSPANLAVYYALLGPGDKVLSLRLDHGGHLTHGSPVNVSGKQFQFIHYPVASDTALVDYEALEEIARKEKPKMILAGYTAYPRTIDFKRIHEIAKSVGALSMADIAHISGLIIGGVHPSPFPFFDVVTTTTHKTLRGPRGAMIFSKPEHADVINKAVFPGMQGGPHEHAIAAIAVALEEAMRPEFKTYAEQIVKNSRALADALLKGGLKLVSGGTDNHLMLIDLRPFGPGRGVFVDKALEAANISVNKTTVPDDPSTPFYPSGIRLGTPAVTTRGMKEAEMAKIGEWIAALAHEFATRELPADKDARSEAVRNFSEEIKTHPLVLKIKEEVKALASQFPVPGI